MATLAARGSGTPATTGTTWASVTNAVDGTAGTNPATYATYTNAVSAAVATIEITGYGFSSSIGAGDTLNSVSVSLRHFENNTGRFASVRFQAFDGATAIGTATTCTLATAARNDVATPAVTLAQLRSSTFKIVVTITGAASTQSRVESIDYVDVTADYTPLPPAITQGAYRFYADGTETGATALASQDTAPTVDTSAGDVNLQVRVRLQSTNAAPPLSTDDWQLQWEKNTSGTWTGVAPPLLGVDIPLATAGVSLSPTQMTAISFVHPAGGTLTKATFRLSQTGTTLGSCFARLYANSGSLPATDPIAESVGVLMSSLTTTMTLTDFTFDGSPQILPGVTYWIAVYWNVSNDGSLRYNTVSSLNYSGSRVTSTSTTSEVWSTVGTSMCFYVTVVGSGIVPYASANLTDAAATTNRLGAGTGSFVAGKISEDGLADDVGWTANNYTELLYSITLKQADLSPSDTLKFRVLRNGATTGLTYTTVPSITIGSAGPTDVTGTATGSISVAGTSSGTKEVTGSAAGSLTVAGAASGAPVTAPVLATATGALTVAGVAAGVRPMTGTGAGAIALAGTAAGQKTVTATLTGAVTVSSSTVGVRATAGTAAGALTLTGNSSGTKTVAATATGALTVTGAATGVTTAAPVPGQAVSAVTVAGVAVGTRGTAGTAVGTLALAGTSSGQKSVTATAAGALTVAGAGSGQKTVTATAAGAVTVTGTAIGAKTVGATATGALTISGSASGLRVAAGTATAAIALTGTAVGQRTATATAVGAITLAGSAAGQKSVAATAAGQITVTSSALGLVEGNAVGIGNGSITLGGAATGVRDTKATATGAITVSGLASGVRGRPGVAVGAITLTGSATATKDVTALAVGNIGLSGTAVGAGVVSNVVGQWNTADVVAYQWGADEVVEWFMVTAAVVKTGTATGTLTLAATATGEVGGHGIATGTITIAATVSGIGTTPAGTDILLEPFNNFTFAPWVNSGASIIAGGRHGNGAQVGAFQQIDFSIPVPNRGTTITVGCAVKLDSAAGTRDIFGFWSPTQFGFSGRVHAVMTTGRIFVTGAAATDLGGVNGLVTAGTWFYVEAQCFLHDTLGTFVVRLNGSEIINLTGRDTRVGTVTVFEVVRLTSNNGVHVYDDLYVTMDAGAPFKGDITV